LSFVKFSPVKEMVSKKASAYFQNFCRLASKKGAESAVFFGLEGTLVPVRTRTIQMSKPRFTSFDSSFHAHTRLKVLFRATHV